MGRKSVLINLVTVIILLGTACLMGGFALVWLNPDLIVAAVGMPPLPTLAPSLAAAPPTGAESVLAFPTLPPAWTPTAQSISPDVPTRVDSPTPGASPTPVVAGGVTILAGSSATRTGIDAQVSEAGGGLRLRKIPGSAGPVITSLNALTPLDIVGRTPDNAWLEVVVPSHERGWVLSQFVDVYVNLVAIPVTAAATLDASPTPITLGEAQVSANGNGLRLRQSPGTAGQIIVGLTALTPLDLVGRTDDSAWLEVVTGSAQRGWVMARYVDVFINLADVPVTGQAVDATAPPPTATRTPRPPPSPTNTRAPPTATATRQPTATWTAPPPPAGNPTSGPTSQAPPPTGYISGISPHAREIYLAGLSLGNRPGVFSKVGDSITVSPQFLSPIGNGNYNLRDYAYLGEAVAHFSASWARTGNSFANVSLAAKGGWSSSSVLSPSVADPSLCQQDETPLACEYRLTEPSVALIMLGTNDVLGTSSEAYQTNLRRIVEVTIQKGVLPVLSTIPPFLRSGYEARADELNAIIVTVAQEYDIPVWHYHASLEGLPNLGMSPDGIHPSWSPGPADFTPQNLQAGYTMRNLTALLVLDDIWRQVMY